MKAKFPNLQRVRLFEEVANQLKDAILSGSYQPGDLLPSEGELSEQFGVSRNVVREAIRVLQSKGFLEIRPGKNGGSRVSEFKSTTIIENLSDLIEVGYVTPDHLAQARTHLEPEILRLAAVNATPEDLKEIEKILQKYDRTTDKNRRRKLNCDFHRRIGEACGNPLFSILMNTIMDFTERFLQTMNPSLDNAHRLGEHREIFNALKNHEAEKASRLASKHWARLSDEIRKYKEEYLKISDNRRAE